MKRRENEGAAPPPPVNEECAKEGGGEALNHALSPLPIPKPQVRQDLLAVLILKNS